jgi:hypothetical protein
MKTMSMNADEWYPVLQLNERLYGKTAEFTEEEIADIKRVEAEFNRVQKLLFDRFAPNGVFWGFSLVLERRE